MPHNNTQQLAASGGVSPGVVPPEVQKRRTPKADPEFPIAPPPALAMVSRPRNLRIADISN